MRILKQIDSKTRIIITRYYWKALFFAAFRLQRKRKYYWKTVSWIFPSCLVVKTGKRVEDWLVWDESNNADSQYNLGIKIFQNG